MAQALPRAPGVVRADDAIADTEMDVLSLYDGYGYAFVDCPEEAAEDEMAEWRDE